MFSFNQHLGTISNDPLAVNRTLDLYVDALVKLLPYKLDMGNGFRSVRTVNIMYAFHRYKAHRH
jgi:hypothetical protein